jgi:hypothetical protein
MKHLMTGRDYPVAEALPELFRASHQDSRNTFQRKRCGEIRSKRAVANPYRLTQQTLASIFESFNSAGKPDCVLVVSVDEDEWRLDARGSRPDLVSEFVPKIVRLYN